MAQFPIYGVFDGDFVPHLVAVDTDMSMAQVASAIAVHSVGRRIMPRQLPFEAMVGGTAVPLSHSFGEVVAERSMSPLDFVTIRYSD